MPLPRFRIRTLMIAVAVVAVALSSWSLRGESRRRRARAIRHVQEAELASTLVGDYYAGRVVFRDGMTPERAEELAARLERSIPFHAAMAEKWAEAADHPWLPVSPDPPPP
jgi:hypothetical protein